MLDAGVQPLTEYPGSNVAWPCVCLVCGEKVAPRADNVKRGWGACRYCARAKQAKTRSMDAGEAAAMMRAAGLEPLVEYPGWKNPWPCACRTCGREENCYLGNVRAGAGCRHCHHTSRGGNPHLAQRRRKATP